MSYVEVWAETYQRVNLDGLLHRAQTVNLQRLHVENIDTLQLSEQFESFQTGGLVLASGKGHH